MEKILKTGACSIIIGSNIYEGYFPVRDNKLLKITKIGENHNEFKHLSLIRQIENYKDYYSIPDKETGILLKDGEFYNKIMKLTLKDNLNIFDSNLCYMYIDYAGSTDVVDSIDFLVINRYSYIWKDMKSILKFIKHIAAGLNCLHDKKLCHLDIKAENVMINFRNGNPIFKLIDFGFCSKEPFDDFVKYFKGTPGYFPQHFDSIKYTQEGLPVIYANDMDKVNGMIPMVANRRLVYKVDSYCFGRLINLIYYHYLDNRELLCCFDSERSTVNKVKKIINLLVEPDVFKRTTISELYHFNLT